MSYNPYSPVPPFTRPADNAPIPQTQGAPVLWQNGQAASPYAGSGISTMNPYGAQDAQAAQAQMGAINAAGPDVFDRVTSSVRDQRRGMLDAIAGAGSAGKAEYQRIAGIEGARQQTQIAQALSEAQRHNMDPVTLAAIQGGINQPYIEATSARDMASNSWQQLFAAMGVSADKYYTQYENTIPLIQQQFKNDLATNFATARAGAQADIEKGRQSTSLSLAQIQMQERQRQEDIAREEAQRLIENAQWERTFAENNRDDDRDFAEDVRRYGMDYALKAQAARSSGSGSGNGQGGFAGTGMTQTQFKAAVPSAIANMRRDIDPNNIFGSTLGKITGFDKLLNQVAGHNIALQNNVPDSLMPSVMPKYVLGLRNVTPTAGNSSPETLSRVYQLAVEGFDQGVPVDQIIAKLTHDFGSKKDVLDAIDRAGNPINRGVRRGIGAVGSVFS